MELYNSNSDLEAVLKQLRNPNERLVSTVSGLLCIDRQTEDHIQSIKPFQVFTPMASQSIAKIEDIPNLLKDGEECGFYLEEKYDGERVQIHREGSKYQFYSR
jgi:ATP-dependent DNA ligase